MVTVQLEVSSLDAAAVESSLPGDGPSDVERGGEEVNGQCGRCRSREPGSSQ